MFGYRVPAPDLAMLISGGRAEGNANVVVEVGRFLVPCGNRGLLLRARQLLTEATRRVFDQETSTTLDVLYDVSHNLAKLEKHPVDGQTRTVCVHRKGGDPLPAAAPSRPTRRPGHGRPAGADTGHDGHRPYVLAGVPDNPAFFSTAHGAGRVQSRHQAARHTDADALRSGLEQAGILVRGSSRRGLAEEKPETYKDIDAVIETSHRAGLARKIARLIPLGAVKG